MVVEIQDILFFNSMSETDGSDIEWPWILIWNRLWLDLEILFQSCCMSDPTFSDIDFKNEMA